MSEPEDARVLKSLVVEHEIRGATYDFGRGPVDGYEWRLLLTIPDGPNVPPRTEWTDWMFAPHDIFDELLTNWQEYITTHGHLAPKIPPGQARQERVQYSALKT